MTKIVGIISDTHGLLRPEAKAALEGCDAIVHAGDIGKPDVLGALEAIAPVTAIRGNVDKWADTLPDAVAVEIEGRWLYVGHDVPRAELCPRAARFHLALPARRHNDGANEKVGVLYLSRRSARPRRFNLPNAMGVCTVSARAFDAEIIELRPKNGA